MARCQSSAAAPVRADSCGHESTTSTAIVARTSAGKMKNTLTDEFDNFFTSRGISLSTPSVAVNTSFFGMM
ncbi:hypothetical protein [Persicitalea jodogahamensis]|uniref:hypothetical protein n=1 Tax=Persicitalea jodogahamensis TaxID=402147 RepID=UPI001677E033|nr:hypothetical protein [Persicitalea jodogahamensis]